MHPSPPLVRRAENTTNKIKARDTSVRLDQRGSGPKNVIKRRNYHVGCYLYKDHRGSSHL